MATYYKYQNPSEIGTAPTLDWGTVISNVNQTLQDQEKQRYENREQDKKTTNDILQKLNEVSLTSDPKANAVLTRGMYQTKESRMQSFQDLKNGKISRSDYNILGQNTSSSIADLQKFSTEYQSRYAKFQKALSEGTVTDFSKATQEYMGSFQNMTNKDLIYNPKDGFMYVASLDPDTREVVKGPLGMLPISSLNTEKIYNDDKINLPVKLASYTDKIQPFIKILRQGKIESIEGIQQYSEFNEFMTNLTNAIAPDDFAKADLLTQLGIYNVDVTKSSDGKTIGSKRAGDNTIVPDITNGMKDDLKVALTRFIVANEGYKQTGTEVFRPNTGGGGGTTKPTKPQDIPSVGKVVPMYGQKTNKLAGPTFSVSNIRINKGPGLMQEIGGAALRDGQLVITGYLVEGKETASSETDYGKGGFTVTKKTKFTSNPIIKGKRTKAEGLWSSVNGAQMEDIITRIPIPEGQGETFSSVAQAIEFLSEKQQGMSPTRLGEKTEYTNITQTNKGAIGVKNGKWYDIKTGKLIQ